MSSSPSPSARSEAYVSAAASGGDLDAVRALLDAGYPVDQGACELAARNGHAETLAALLDLNVPCGNSVAYAVKRGSVACLDELYDRGNAISKVAVDWALRADATPEAREWVMSRVMAQRAWAMSTQRKLDEHKQSMREQAYIELSNAMMECYRSSATGSDEWQSVDALEERSMR